MRGRRGDEVKGKANAITSVSSSLDAQKIGPLSASTLHSMGPSARLTESKQSP